MSLLSFDSLVNKFGLPTAYHCLLEIEKAAHILPSIMAEVDPETRLENAIRAQDAHGQSILAV
jgi:hypothetical protein